MTNNIRGIFLVKSRKKVPVPFSKKKPKNCLQTKEGTAKTNQFHFCACVEVPHTIQVPTLSVEYKILEVFRQNLKTTRVPNKKRYQSVPEIKQKSIEEVPQDRTMVPVVVNDHKFQEIFSVSISSCCWRTYLTFLNSLNYSSTCN